jgi:putative oxidoreductase
MFGRLLRLGARTSLSVIFVRSGYRMVRDPSRQVALAEKVLPMIPNLDTLARAQAAAMVVGGVALAAGIAPRLAATALAATLIPATYIGHQFWTVEDPAARQQQLTHFMKNVGLFGGLLYIATDSRGSHHN